MTEGIRKTCMDEKADADEFEESYVGWILK